MKNPLLGMHGQVGKKFPFAKSLEDGKSSKSVREIGVY